MSNLMQHRFASQLKISNWLLYPFKFGFTLYVIVYMYYTIHTVHVCIVCTVQYSTVQARNHGRPTTILEHRQPFQHHGAYDEGCDEFTTVRSQPTSARLQSSCSLRARACLEIPQASGDRTDGHTKRTVHAPDVNLQRSSVKGTRADTGTVFCNLR